MPQCSDYGEGWAGEYPNCTYQTPGFTGSVESLGYGGLLPTDIEGRPYEDYFDPYDPTQQQMAETVAGTKVGAAESAWSLQQEQLGEAAALKTGQLGKTWGLQRGQLGWGAGMGVSGARRAGIGAKRKSEFAFSGTAEEMQRTAEADVMTKYRGGIRAGETAYQQALRTTETGLQQALRTGQLGLEQEITDIFQQLGQDVLGFQQDWQGGQQQTYFNLLGLGLDWGDAGGGPVYDDPNCFQNCINGGASEDYCEVSCGNPAPSDPQTCAEQGLVECTDPNANNYGLCGPCDYGE